jgi:hypothetical protein
MKEISLREWLSNVEDDENIRLITWLSSLEKTKLICIILDLLRKLKYAI